MGLNCFFEDPPHMLLATQDDSTQWDMGRGSVEGDLNGIF